MSESITRKTIQKDIFQSYTVMIAKNNFSFSDTNFYK